MGLRGRYVLCGAAVVLIIVAVIAGIRVLFSNGGANLSTSAVVADLRAAGARDAIIVQHSNAGDVVGPPSLRKDRGWLLPLYAVRFPSSLRAERTYTHGYNPSALASQAGEVRKRAAVYKGVVPQGWPDGVRAERICNVIVVSNNPSHSALLTRQAHVAVELLRRRCA
jgi:hypothetical protein